MTPAIPPSFALPSESRLRLSVPERNAIDALLAHTATTEQFSIVECICEVGIRAIKKAQKAPHCKNLEPEGLKQALHIYHRAGHALDRIKARKEETGVYGLSAADRVCIQEMDSWGGLLASKGHIPRAIWLAALRDGAHRKGRVVLIPLEQLEAA
jgi:hypothetical protein